MKTRLNIRGEYKSYDLIRIRSITLVEVDDFVIVWHPESGDPCKAQIVDISDKSISVRECCNDDAPYRWNISRRNLFRDVFKIN